ncbi:hypothetical protein G7054_g7944 [Neopestalotiopsis clavispora]|nr:hypothetical protein G7054_g7944 [Neopestalotiopsis clavispora]
MVRNKSEIPWNSLPNTFRDAIEVTRQLGVRYLWIDSLCIIQDDENDWKQESSKMVEVYQNAYLTIYATGGQNDDAGLWPRVVPKLIEEVMINYEGKEYKVYFKDAEDNWASHLNWWTDYGHEDNRVREISPLITRGWALQERILSSRLLHYGHGELLWQCRESTTCECCYHDSEGSSYMHSLGDAAQGFMGIIRGYPSADNIAQNWRLLVEQYSNLDLTLAKDVLPALSALAYFSSMVRHGDHYLAGLWKNSIIGDMCWYLDDYIPTRGRPDKWCAPTYSWASVRERVTYGKKSSIKNSFNYAQLIRSSTVLAGPHPMGEVLSGSVVLRGPVQVARFTQVNKVGVLSLPTRKYSNAMPTRSPTSKMVLSRMMRLSSVSVYVC